MEFPWVLVFNLEISTEGVSQKFSEFTGLKACFLRVKYQIKKSQGFFYSEKYIYPQPCLEFFWNNPIAILMKKEAGSAMHIMSPTRLPRSNLPSLI